MKFKTTAAYVSGAICGNMWMPNALAGKLINKSLRGPWGIMDSFTEPVSFEDALNHLLMSDGGDFQNALFTADTIIRIERRAIDAPGKYRIHVKEIQLSDLTPDLVSESYTSDFMSEND